MNYNHMSRSELIEELNRKDKIIKRMKYILEEILLPPCLIEN